MEAKLPGSSLVDFFMRRVFTSLTDTEMIALLKGGAVGIIPTDTVYGLVASAAHEKAVERLYDLKTREMKPGTVIAANVQQLVDLGIHPKYLDRVKDLWPGPVSIETPHDIVYLHQGTGRQAFRIPADPVIYELLLKTGPLQTTSANLPGATTASDYAEAKAYFGDRVDFYVEGGDLGDRPASTIVRFNEQGELEVIREGAVHVTKDGHLA
jgi:L-threonylcarbamoyladenylate synthase